MWIKRSFVLVAMLAGLALGFDTIISAMTTKYRDLQVLFSFIVQLWMYATPIVYPLSQTKSMFWNGIPVHKLMCLNPVTPIIETFKYGFSRLWRLCWLEMADLQLCLHVGSARFGCDCIQKGAEEFYGYGLDIDSV